MRKGKIISENHQKKSFPIVGIGGSAGGLEAFEELLKNIAPNPGMAFVFIMHLSPTHKSMLPELLARLTKMPVIEITNGMIPKINHVYVKSPNTNLYISSGKFILTARGDISLKHMPIDYFFSSLAEEFGNRSIGVIMSGTATDGTEGAKTIKSGGGIVFVQDAETAKYNDMPQSAISSGCVDFTLSPKKIAIELGHIARHPFMSSESPIKKDRIIITEDNDFESIFNILFRSKGLDFSYYKTATMSRRISRRVILTKQSNFKNYLKFLRENNNEVEGLYEDLLINVTSFFRDQKVFYTLGKKFIPAIIKNKTKDQGVRVWVPGCSSGEEAYSIAMLFAEALGRKAGLVPVQIFGTDMSEISINKARRGAYSLDIKGAVTDIRLKRFFTKEGSCYKISKNLREMCVFSKQNVFSDPPFSNIDLISCRNLLIYLQPILQKKVFHNFHYSLRPGGFLILGNSESLVSHSNLFKSLDRKRKIFVKKYVPIRPGFDLVQSYYPSKKLEFKKKVNIDIREETDIELLADKVLLNEYVPCGVLVDSNLEVIQFRGHTGRFLEPTTGKPSLNIFKLAREGLLVPLRSAIYKARKIKRTVKREANDVLYNGHKVSVMITVVPLKSADLREEFFLVLFEIGSTTGPKNLTMGLSKISLKRRSVERDSYIKDLEKELVETKEYLQTVIEEQGDVNEEEKAANEEILSSNEELQSANEELETAKEELQSSNEELTTANEELQNRSAEVSLLNNDLINFIGSINFPVVMMGMDLTIRRVTPQADKVLNIAPSDVGRPISKIKLNIEIPDLEKILFDVIESFQSKTFEIKNKDGNWYSVHIRPYRTLDNKIDGVTAVFVDITESKNLEGLLQIKSKEQEGILNSAPAMIFYKDKENRYVRVNKALEDAVGLSKEQLEGKLMSEIYPKEQAEAFWKDDLEVIKSGKVKRNIIESLETSQGTRIVQTDKIPYLDEQGNIIGIIGFAIDITERKKIENALNEAVKAKSAFTSMVSHELRTPLTSLKQNIYLLSEKKLGEVNKEQKEFLDIAKTDVDRLARLINEILDFQTFESGKMTFKMKNNDINEAVEENKRTMNIVAQEKGVDLILNLDKDLPKIRFDRDKIIQVLSNLVNNSLKLIKNGSITISTTRKNNVIQVSVKDTGPGIREKDMPRLFQKFEQLERKIGGTGLGLVISSEIIKAHKGKIWVESIFGQGATVHFVLPIE